VCLDSNLFGKSQVDFKFCLGLVDMPFWSRKKKPTREEEMAASAANAAAKGLVESSRAVYEPGQYGYPERVWIKNWVTPEIAAQRNAERVAERARVNEENRIFNEKKRADEVAAKKVLRDRKLAACRDFIAQAEAEDAAAAAVGGTLRKKRGTRKTRRL
jgi:hypothetical protein